MSSPQSSQPSGRNEQQPVRRVDKTDAQTIVDFGSNLPRTDTTVRGPIARGPTVRGPTVRGQICLEPRLQSLSMMLHLPPRSILDYSMIVRQYLQFQFCYLEIHVYVTTGHYQKSNQLHINLQQIQYVTFQSSFQLLYFHPNTRTRTSRLRI